MFENSKIGDNVEFFRSGKMSLGKESQIVKITKTQIHISFKNGDAPANGDTRKFNKITGKEIGKTNSINVNTIKAI